MVLPPVDEALLASLVPKIANKSYGTETTVSEMHIRKALMAGRRSDNDVRDWITMKLGAFDPSAADPTINDPIPKVVKLVHANSRAFDFFSLNLFLFIPHHDFPFPDHPACLFSSSSFPLSPSG